VVNECESRFRCIQAFCPADKDFLLVYRGPFSNGFSGVFLRFGSSAHNINPLSHLKTVLNKKLDAHFTLIIKLLLWHLKATECVMDYN